MNQFNKKNGLLIRSLVAVSVICCSAWGLAAAMESQAGQAAPPRGASAGQARTPAANAAPGQDANSVIRLLRFAMTTEQTRLLGLTDNAAKQDQILRAVNVGMIATTSPDQTSAYVDFLQIDKYRGDNPDWQKVAKTKSAMKALLQVDAKAEAHVDAEWDKIWDEIVSRDKSDLAAHREWLTKRVQGVLSSTRSMLDSADQKELDAVWNTFKQSLPSVQP